MKSLTSLIMMILLLAPVSLSAQDLSFTRNMTLEQLMEEKIRKLKNGALLVRLQTKEQSIDALRKAGNEEQARQVEAKQIAYNKEVIAAFRKEFTFCPVYFFPSQYSDTLRSGAVNSVVFVNDSLVPDPSIRVLQTDFLTAEFGTLDPDTVAYYEGKYYDYSGDGLDKQKSYYGGADMGFAALRIMNSYFVQLKKPFPYYVKTYESLPVERKMAKAVAKMNKQLEEYYKLNKIK